MLTDERPWRVTEPITSAEVFVGFSSGEIAGLFVAGSLVVAAWVTAGVVQYVHRHAAKPTSFDTVSKPLI